MIESPYLVIAAELRRRIQTGELQPGDHVPSTRSLVRDFGVAMATATKALKALQDERLVHASPGVGTVVGPPPKSRTERLVRRPVTEPSGLALERPHVVRMALAIADPRSCRTSYRTPTPCWQRSNRSQKHQPCTP